MSLINPVKIFEHMEERICSIHTSVGTATGFFISEKGLIATILRIIPAVNGQINAADITVKYKQKEYSVSVSTPLTLPIDLCLLQISTPISTPCFSLMQKTFSDLKIGTEVYFAGFSLKPTTPNFHQGMVSFVSSHENGVHRFTIDGTIVQGNSGGPIIEVNEDKLQLIGMVFQKALDIDVLLDKPHQLLNVTEKKTGMELLPSFLHKNTEDKEAKEITPENQLLLKIIDILQSMPTQVQAFHSQHIIQLLSLITTPTLSVAINSKVVQEVSKPTEVSIESTKKAKETMAEWD